MPSDSYDFVKEFQSLYISQQKPALPAVSENMKVCIQSYPPLGQVTLIQRNEVTLTCLLEIPNFRAIEPWEVSLWHSVDGSEWQDMGLHRMDGSQTPRSLQEPSESTSRFYFSTTLSLKTSIQFTLRFRHGPDEEWRWIRDEQGLKDGSVVTTSASVGSDELLKLIPDLNNEWTVSSRVSQSPGTLLWALETPISAVKEDNSTYKDIEIGTPWGSFFRWFALVRLWSPWLAPRHGTTEFMLDKEAILCSFMGLNGRNLVFLALSGVKDVLSVFQNTPRGTLSVHARSDALSEESVTILVAEGDAFENAVAAVMYEARTMLSRAFKAEFERDQDLAAAAPADDFQPSWMVNWYDGLGFCTWNALGQRLTAQKIIEAVDKLAEHNVKISSLIIDDNWQSIDYKGSSQFQHGWKDFEAEPAAFPDGLKATITQIRESHPNIQHIAVWHALLGYWGGISPDGKIAKTYKTVEVVREDAERRNLPLGGKMTVVAKEDVSRFYDDFYRFLEDCGVNAVKTDAQFMIDTWVGAGARRDLIKTYLDAWTISILRHFSARAISCMSQVPQALFYSQMPTTRPTILVRNSDDFFPEIPSSHPWHVWANAYNSIFMKHLNVLPDWDMFQTVHDYSEFHAAARCVSGGPIYITDVPGQHNMSLIRQMTGVTPRGRTVIFRPSCVGKAVDPYVGYDDDLLLKVGSYHGSSLTGTPILGIFNISTRLLTELIPFSSFPGVDPSIVYVIRAHASGMVSQPTRLDDPSSLTAISLPVRGYEILCAFPLTLIPSQTHGEVLVANFGLLGKMTGAAAILNTKISKRDNGRILLNTRVKAFGIVGLYISSLPEMTIMDDFIATIRDQPIPPHTVSISETDSHVLEIDIERAWNEMGLESSWSNDIQVKVYFSS